MTYTSRNWKKHIVFETHVHIIIYEKIHNIITFKIPLGNPEFKLFFPTYSIQLSMALLINGSSLWNLHTLNIECGSIDSCCFRRLNPVSSLSYLKLWLDHTQHLCAPSLATWECRRKISLFSDYRGDVTQCHISYKNRCRKIYFKLGDQAY